MNGGERLAGASRPAAPAPQAGPAPQAATEAPPEREPPAGPGPGVVGGRLEADPAVRAGLSWNSDGLVAAIAVDATRGDVLMLAWVSPEALDATLRTGRAWYWSRSRRSLWCKGETSGDRQWVREVLLDCDGDALLYLVDQEGRGACHTGDRSCFSRRLAVGPERGV